MIWCIRTSRCGLTYPFPLSYRLALALNAFPQLMSYSRARRRLSLRSSGLIFQANWTVTDRPKKARRACSPRALGAAREITPQKTEQCLFHAPCFNLNRSTCGSTLHLVSLRSKCCRRRKVIYCGGSCWTAAAIFVAKYSLWWAPRAVLDYVCLVRVQLGFTVLFYWSFIFHEVCWISRKLKRLESITLSGARNLPTSRLWQTTENVDFPHVAALVSSPVVTQFFLIHTIPCSPHRDNPLHHPVSFRNVLTRPIHTGVFSPPLPLPAVFHPHQNIYVQCWRDALCTVWPRALFKAPPYCVRSRGADDIFRVERAIARVP